MENSGEQAVTGATTGDQGSALPLRLLRVLADLADGEEDLVAVTMTLLPPADARLVAAAVPAGWGAACQDARWLLTGGPARVAALEARLLAAAG